MRWQKLQDKLIIAVIAPCVPQNARPIIVSSKIGKPLKVLARRLFTNAPNILHHHKIQSIRIQAGKVRTVKTQLRNNVGVIVNNLQKCSLSNLTGFIKTIYDIVLHECCASLINYFSLFLRVQILRKEPHNTDHLSLPRPKHGTVFFKKIQDVFLGDLHVLLTLIRLNIC